MEQYLRRTEVMDYDHPEVGNLVRALAGGVSDPTTIAKRSFEWVRDEIRHSGDFRVNQPACAASEVLRHGAGWCFRQEPPVGRAPEGERYSRRPLLPAFPPGQRHEPVRAARPERRSIVRVRVVQNRPARQQARGGRSVRSPERKVGLAGDRRGTRAPSRGMGGSPPVGRCRVEGL